MKSVVRKQIKSDKYVKKVIKMIDSGAFNIDTDLLLKEISNMHRSRKSRNLQLKDVVKHSQDSIIKASLQNQSYRSRCSEIKNNCITIITKLDRHIKYLKNHLKHEYNAVFNDYGYKTNVARESIIEDCLKKVLQHIDDVKTVDNACNILIEDLDKTSISINTILRTLELSTRPERNL